jgi:hypothetical protein
MSKKALLGLVLALLVAAGALIGRGIASRQQSERSAALPGPLPTGAIEILDARPFAVDEPFVHEWRAEKPLASAGYLLALQVDPELARPRQTYEPVLYVGEQTAERFNAPETGGVLIVLVPAPLDPSGRVALDLDTAPIWFGSLELPERVDAARIAREVAAARAAGIGPARRAVAELRTGAGDTIHARTRWELEPYVEDWIARYSR